MWQDSGEILAKKTMKKIFTDNQWGYDIKTTNPFWIALYNLREVAKESVGEENVLDLSRGDPGYGFSPSLAGREFYSYLLFVDTILNNFDNHFVYDRRSYDELMTFIEAKTHAEYASERAERFLADFAWFIKEILEISARQGLGYTERDVLFHLFKYASVSGGCYHDPQGEEICRAVIADYYSQEINYPIVADDLVFLPGVSGGIGTFFKLLGDEGISFLKTGDTVLSISPAYAPYNAIFKNRGLNVLSVSIDQITGDFDQKSLQVLEAFAGRIKLFSLIDPGNPTGLRIPRVFKERMVSLATKHNGIILTDEVYAGFCDDTSSIFSMAPERTLRLNARSKIERSTGLRFGDFLIPKATNDYLTQNILADYLEKGVDFKKAIMLAKAPGGIKGEFMHVSFVPGPAQFLGISHILFGEADRKRYVDMVKENTKEFSKILGLKYENNSYYTVFDLNAIASDQKRTVQAEEKFYQLAKRGVVMIPANLFYSESDHAENDLNNMARACLPNLTFHNIQKAAKIIKEYLAE